MPLAPFLAEEVTQYDRGHDRPDPGCFVREHTIGVTLPAAYLVFIDGKLMTAFTHNSETNTFSWPENTFPCCRGGKLEIIDLATGNVAWTFEPLASGD